MTKKYYSYDIRKKQFILEANPYFGYMGPPVSETKEGALKNLLEYLKNDLEFHEGRAKDIRKDIAAIPKSVDGIPTLLIEPAVETLVP